MMCPRCNREMRKGYLFSTVDDGFGYADEVPGMLHKARSAEGYIEITPLTPNHRASVEAYCCEDCKLILFEY